MPALFTAPAAWVIWKAKQLCCTSIVSGIFRGWTRPSLPLPEQPGLMVNFSERLLWWNSFSGSSFSNGKEINHSNYFSTTKSSPFIYNCFQKNRRSRRAAKEIIISSNKLPVAPVNLRRFPSTESSPLLRSCHQKPSRPGAQQRLVSGDFYLQRPKKDPWVTQEHLEMKQSSCVRPK